MKEINPLRKRNTVNEGQCIYKDTNNSLFKKILLAISSINSPNSSLLLIQFNKICTEWHTKKNLLEKKCIISIMDTIGESCVEAFKI